MESGNVTHIITGNLRETLCKSEAGLKFERTRQVKFDYCCYELLIRIKIIK